MAGRRYAHRGADRLLALDEVKDRLSVSKVTVKRKVADGELASVKIGDRRLVRASDLAVYIASLAAA